jgi:SPP1 gp7 family putative phage head morphogenesis protein
MTPQEVDKEFERIAKGVYDGSITNIDAALFDFTVGVLMKSEFAGFGTSLAKVEWGTPDQKLLSVMQGNTFWFAGAKTFSQLQTMSNLLTGDDGKVREWNDFKNKALQAHQLYNVTWLDAEYNHAIAASQMASRWMDFQRNKALRPLLRYQTMEDDRVRPEHEVLDGITAEVDDIFWTTHYPPIAWRCRCDVISVGSGKVTDLTQRDIPVLPKFFAQNVGITGQVYPEGHPYYDLLEKDKAAEKEVKQFVNQQLKKANEKLD